MKIKTSRGSYFDIKSPGDSYFVIEEIAHALSHICRFTGHTKKFYSVAQHSVLCSISDGDFAFERLMHDAQEAFIGDVSSPLKRLLPCYHAIETDIENAISSQYRLNKSESASREVEFSDLTLLATEKRDLMISHADDDEQWKWLDGLLIAPLECPIRAWTSIQSKHAFLARFYQLCPDDFLIVSRWQHVLYHRVHSFGRFFI
jgi:hypothetical protein